MPQDWTMPRRSDRCAACSREFEPSALLNACLYETPAGYERRDYCTSCTVPAEPAPLGAWRTRRTTPSGRAAATIDKAALLPIFEQLADATDRQHVQFRFVLALLLWRKRVLKLEGTRDEGGAEYWDFTQPATNVVHAVTRPELDEGELEQLSAGLEALIAGGELGPLADVGAGPAAGPAAATDGPPDATPASDGAPAASPTDYASSQESRA